MPKDYSVEIPIELAHEIQSFITHVKAHEYSECTRKADGSSTFKDLIKKYKYEMGLTYKLEYLKTYADIMKIEAEKEYKKMKETIAKDELIRICERLNEKETQYVDTE
ncbi:hypothetical protein ECANGB1_774 [Enterospora canceri]|uniref:Uncharacterized protein n=1 Tax=Enterospora canceri TaxID=1081671 RepID=A0A1Y1S869_9MICR|nr:hypothetical protein ECANGB1_774 [Enterospora canceri]